MNSAKQKGFTLIELVMFIVVVSVGLAGILSVMNLNAQHSVDPMVRKQAAALADSIMEEILLKAYSDPDGTETGETGRDTYDDVDDYNGKDQTLFADLLTLGVLSSYSISISVDVPADFNGVTAKKVTVTVSNGAENVSLIGYRAEY
jgi:MSHA pilin protein MshD